MTVDQANLGVKLDRLSKESLGAQLYHQMRESILSGTLAPGQRIPSTRELAQKLKVSRSTVKDCYRQLITEGYLESKAASSTFVATSITALLVRQNRITAWPAPQNSITAMPAPQNQDGLDDAELASLSAYGKYVVQATLQPPQRPDLDVCFYSWRPALDEFPLEDWSRILWRTTRTTDLKLLDFPADKAGSMRLRAAIARFVEHREIKCGPEQVVIVSGFQQAVALVARLYVDNGDAIAVENPSFPESRKIFASTGANVVPVQVDDDGLSVQDLASKSRYRFKLVYVTPSHQFPSGAILPLSRRLELLSWARQHGAVIVEDDYDSEFRHVGHAIPALKSLDGNDSVVYLSTFNKLLFPSLGLAFLIVPKRFVPLYTDAHFLNGDPMCLHLQEALAEFIEDGHLSRHVKRMSLIYERRRQALVDALQKNFKGSATISGDDAGLHALVRFDLPIADEDFVIRAAAAGVGIVSTAPYYMDGPRAGEFSFGYGNLSEQMIGEGMKRLSRAAKQ